MSGELINDYGIGDVHFDRWMETTDAQRIGFHSLTLTNYDNTTVPAIAAGSKIEINGALAVFDSEEAISGSPSDGDVYIYFAQELGTASGATTDSAGYSIGTTTITLASAGTGTIIVGDRVTFAGDTVKYEITSGDADVSNGGTITIASPGLLTAIPAAPTAITVYAGAVTANFTNTAPTWSDSKQGWYGTGGNANYRYANFIMDKSGSSYDGKRYYLPNPISRFDTFDFKNFLTENIAAEGYIKLGSIYVQWGEVAAGVGSITFPIEFPNNAYSIAMSGSYYLPFAGDYRPSYILNLTTTGCDVYNNDGADSYWIAIGN